MKLRALALAVCLLLTMVTPAAAQEQLPQDAGNTAVDVSLSVTNTTDAAPVTLNATAPGNVTHTVYDVDDDGIGDAVGQPAAVWLSSGEHRVVGCVQLDGGGELHCVERTVTVAEATPTRGQVVDAIVAFNQEDGPTRGQVVDLIVRFNAYPDGFEAEFMDKPHPQNAEGV